MSDDLPKLSPQPLNYVSAPKKRRRGDPLDLFMMLTLGFPILGLGLLFVGVAMVFASRWIKRPPSIGDVTLMLFGVPISVLIAWVGGYLVYAGIQRYLRGPSR